MSKKEEGKTNKPSRGGKTNKTAHVLSLLTDPNEAKTEAAETQQNAEKASAPTPAASSAPAVLEVVRANDDAVSDKIKDDLAKALEGELLEDGLISETAAPQTQDPPAPAAEAPQTQETSAPAAEAPQTQETSAPAAEAPQTQETSAPAAEAPQVQETPAPAAEAPQVQETPAPLAVEVPQATMPKPVQTPAGITCMNVMRELVEEKADKYIKKFGLCSCPRCRVDVIALALTNLPAKYVVVRDTEVIPMLTVYEGRYNAAVIAQVMWACKRVIDFPRH